MIHIQDSKDPRISEFFSLRDNILKKNNQMIVETRRIVKKAIKSNLKVYKVLGTQDFLNEQCLDGIETYYASKEILESIVGFSLHHGILALVERPTFYSIEELGSKVIILNGLTSPENVGTIVRSSLAFGVNSMIIDKKTCSPYVRRAIRVSMGNVFNMKIHFADDLVTTINDLTRREYQIVSSANEENAKNIKNFSFKKKCGVIIGSEGHGVDQIIKEISRDIVKIPIDDHVAHLNAAGAAAVFLFSLGS